MRDPVENTLYILLEIPRRKLWKKRLLNTYAISVAGADKTLTKSFSRQCHTEAFTVNVNVNLYSDPPATLQEKRSSSGA